MATTTRSDMNDMLRSYAPNKLFREETVKRNWFLSNVEHDESWLGDALEVRFKSAGASSLKFGSLTDSSDIGSSKFTKGSVTNQPEAWGSLIFNEKDLMRHGKLSEQNFLKLLPDEIEDYLEFMKMGLSLCFTNGPSVVKVTDATNAATGIMILDRVERVELDQKFQIVDNDTAAVAVYVTNINMETSAVTFSLTRGGAAANLAAYSVAQVARLVLDGQETAANQLTSLKSSLLSAANGGGANLYGVSKLAAPYTQAINVSGVTIGAANILDKLFEAQTTVRLKGKGNPDIILCSYKHLGSILSRLETVKGAFRQASEMKASLFGWTEVEVVGVKGKLKIVAVPEMDDDYMVIFDKSAAKIYSNGGVQKRVSPNGDEFHEIRNTSGYQYIVDIAFMGDMVLERPSRCGIIHSISY